jgi:hypothetical protein
MCTLDFQMLATGPMLATGRLVAASTADASNR